MCLLLFGVVSVAEIYIARKFNKEIEKICEVNYYNKNLTTMFYNNYTTICNDFNNKTDNDWLYSMNFENLSKFYIKLF
jgi:hypothetical protein